MNFRLFLLLPVLVAIVASTSYAQYGYGTSSISTNTSAISVVAGQAASVSYTVNLASGSTWGTYINVANSKALSGYGINVSLSKSYADPTYKGTLEITTGSKTPAGTYNITLNATGDDPSQGTSTLKLTVMAAPSSHNSTTVPSVSPTTSTKPSSMAFMDVVGKGTTEVNATSNAITTLSLNNSLLRIKVVINKGTYAKINGTRVSNYNFSIVLFKSYNYGVPNANYSQTGLGFAFAVNNKINETYTFVNSSGGKAPVTTYVYAPENWTTWTVLGGQFNGTAYNGGSFVFANKWIPLNSTYIENTQFFAPVPWIFLAATPVTATTSIAPASTTVPYKASSSGYKYAAIAVIIIIVIALIAYLATRRK